MSKRQSVTVLPVATITRWNYFNDSCEYTVTDIELDANESCTGESLHVVNGVDAKGIPHWWFETSDSLKALMDDALGND